MKHTRYLVIGLFLTALPSIVLGAPSYLDVEYHGNTYPNGIVRSVHSQCENFGTWDGTTFGVKCGDNAHLVTLVGYTPDKENSETFHSVCRIEVDNWSSGFFDQNHHHDATVRDGTCKIEKTNSNTFKVIVTD